jgi:hypothetical protein
LRRTNLPAAERHEVSTQEVLPSGKIDLVLRGFDSAGTLTTVLYAEHKEPGGGWQQGQPGKYLSDLSRETGHGASGRLLIVVGSREDVAGRVRHRARTQAAAATEEAVNLAVKQRSPRVVFTTWQELGGLAEEAGQEAATTDGDWRDAAARPDSRADQRILIELLWYLEEKGYAVTKPLTEEHLKIFHQTEELETTLGTLIAGAAERLTDEKVAGFWLEKPKRTSAADGLYQRFVAPSRSWVARHGGKLYLGFDEEPADQGSRLGQLAFSVSVELLKRQGERLREREAFMSDLKDRGLRFEIDDDRGYCWSSLPATELAGIDTIDGQIERLGAWAKEAFGRLLTLKAGPNRAQ